MMTTFYFAGCLVLAAGAVYMVLAPCYEDGIFGKLWIGAMGLGAGAALVHALTGQVRMPPIEAVVAIDGTAMFMVRHLWRFRRFCLRRKDAL